jgi:hypothetical protein
MRTVHDWPKQVADLTAYVLMCAVNSLSDRLGLNAGGLIVRWQASCECPVQSAGYVENGTGLGSHGQQLWQNIGGLQYCRLPCCLLALRVACGLLQICDVVQVHFVRHGG